MVLLKIRFAFLVFSNSLLIIYWIFCLSLCLSLLKLAMSITHYFKGLQDFFGLSLALSFFAICFVTRLLIALLVLHFRTGIVRYFQELQDFFALLITLLVFPLQRL